MAVRQWGATCLPVADDEEGRATHDEMMSYLQGLLSEHKEDIHQEKFFTTPAGLVDNIWEAVLMREDLGHAVQQWSGHRLRTSVCLNHDNVGQEVASEPEDNSVADTRGSRRVATKP